MVIRLFKILPVFLFVCLSALHGVNAEGKPNYLDYWNKGGERLSIKEFNILIQELEKSMNAFKEAYNTIDIGDANFSYKRGKEWEMVLNVNKENLENAFQAFEKVKKVPSSMRYSLGFYIILNMVLEIVWDIDDISQFEKCLDRTHINLSFWLRAFQDAHLIRLAYIKDRD
ncbi:MAG: hypothetical protein ABIK27_01730, partial [Bacteroidota bacterium]